ncbi:hypothetical protein DFH09DRAFT_1091279 [Mycena vulgaris]|nr:hypothetical protein DFH09DRAFT_1091279 [Mycena vulgaris]
MLNPVCYCSLSSTLQCLTQARRKQTSEGYKDNVLNAPMGPISLVCTPCLWVPHRARIEFMWQHRLAVLMVREEAQANPDSHYSFRALWPRPPLHNLCGPARTAEAEVEAREVETNVELAAAYLHTQLTRSWAGLTGHAGARAVQALSSGHGWSQGVRTRGDCKASGRVDEKGAGLLEAYQVFELGDSPQAAIHNGDDSTDLDYVSSEGKRPGSLWSLIYTQMHMSVYPANQATKQPPFAKYLSLQSAYPMASKASSPLQGHQERSPLLMRSDYSQICPNLAR